MGKSSLTWRIGEGSNASIDKASSAPPAAINKLGSAIQRSTQAVAADDNGARPMKTNTNTLIARPSMAGATLRWIQVNTVTYM